MSTSAMLMYRTIAKKVFREFNSIVMQNLGDILPLFCTQWKPRITIIIITSSLIFLIIFITIISTRIGWSACRHSQMIICSFLSHLRTGNLFSASKHQQERNSQRLALLKENDQTEGPSDGKLREKEVSWRDKYINCGSRKISLFRFLISDEETKLRSWALGDLRPAYRCIENSLILL